MRKASIIQLIVLMVYLPLPLLFGTAYQLRVLNLLVVFTLFTLSSNIIFGHTRQLFLCHGALVGIGAYTSTLLSMNLGITPWILFLIGALLSGGIGSLLSNISSIRRLTLILMAILTLVFQIMFEELVIGLREITGGDEGFVLRLDIIRVPNNVSRELAYYYVFVVILFASVLIYSRIINSHVGVAFKSITEDETAAAFVGINVVKYKVLSAFIGSFLLGLIGGIYVYYNRYIGPSMFSLQSIDNTDTNSRYMHDKVMIVDGVIVVTGSYDWTETAETYNDENVIVISSAQIASAYEEEFSRIWKLSRS